MASPVAAGRPRNSREQNLPGVFWERREVRKSFPTLSMSGHESPCCVFVAQYGFRASQMILLLQISFLSPASSSAHDGKS